MDVDIYIYTGLFFTALVAATLLPAQSELVLGALLYAGDQPAWMLIVVATAGNTLGSAVNWTLGRYFSHFQDRKWFSISPKALQKAEHWYHKYGRWSLLLSWTPIIGDPLTLVAGFLREPFSSFVAIVACAKLARYLVVAGITFQWLGLIF